jgi:hypothetical protein
MFCRSMFCGALAAGLLSSGPLLAAEKTAADLLPESVVAYVEVPQPAGVVGLVLDHPLAEEIRGAPEIEKALASPQYAEYQEVLAHVEKQLGRPWREALKSLTHGGVHLGIDLPTRSGVGLARGDDPAHVAKALATALELVRAEAEKRGVDDPVKTTELRGVSVHQIDKVYLAAIDHWLIAAGNPGLVGMVLELYQDGGQSLADDGQFQAARSASVVPQSAEAPPPAAWLYVDLRVLRLTGILKDALSKKSDNPALELLAGGVIGGLPAAPYVTARLDLAASGAKLTASLPCDPAEISAKREFYLGPAGKGQAPPLLSTEGTLLSLSTYRDFASLWRHAPDLFDEGTNAKFAEAESGLTTLFAGRNFRDDILGNLEPGLQLVVARQQFPQEGITPAIKLPAGAIVVRMKNPAETARIFKVTFQSAIGFLNVVGAMNGAPPLDMNSREIDGSLVVSGEYLPPGAGQSADEAPIQYNASPTIAIRGEQFILASSKPLAIAMLEAVKNAPAPVTGKNTRLLIDGPSAQAALADNRDPLIAQNMLEKGHDREAAEREIGGLVQIVGRIQQSAADLSVGQDKLELSLELKLAERK